MRSERILIVIIVLILCLGSTAAIGEVVSETVPYTDGEVSLEGYLAYDKAIGAKRPGVLIVHEWWGLNDYVRQRAEQLARMGYVAFAVDMYGKGKATEHPEEASEWMMKVTENIETWRNRAAAGLAQLRKHRLADDGRIAAIGYCFGGSTVQQLAYGGEDIKGVVSFHGSLVMPPEGITDGVPAKILILHGASDPMVEKGTVPDYITAMEKTGIDWQMIVYGGARHSFTNPKADQVKMDALAYDKTADRRSWAHMKLFFEELFNP